MKMQVTKLFIILLLQVLAIGLSNAAPVAEETINKQILQRIQKRATSGDNSCGERLTEDERTLSDYFLTVYKNFFTEDKDGNKVCRNSYKCNKINPNYCNSDYHVAYTEPVFQDESINSRSGCSFELKFEIRPDSHAVDLEIALFAKTTAPAGTQYLPYFIYYDQARGKPVVVNYLKRNLCEGWQIFRANDRLVKKYGQPGNHTIELILTVYKFHRGKVSNLACSDIKNIFILDDEKPVSEQPTTESEPVTTVPPASMESSEETTKDVSEDSSGGTAMSEEPTGETMTEERPTSLVTEIEYRPVMSWFIEGSIIGNNECLQ